MKTFIKNNYVKILFITILLLTAILRFTGLTSVVNGLDYDQMYSIHIANQSFPIGIINSLIETDYHPPLFFFILKLWMLLFGNSEISVHALGAIISTATIWLAYLIGKEILNKNLGLFTAFSIAISTPLITYAHYVRFYTLSIFLMLLCTLFAIKTFKKPDKTRNLIVFTLSNLALIYTQTTMVLFIIVEILTLLFFIGYFKKENLFRFIKHQIIFILLAIPQFIMTFIQYKHAQETFWNNPWEWVEVRNFGNFVLSDIITAITNLHLELEVTGLHIAIYIIFGIIFFTTIRKFNKNSLIIFITTLFYILLLFGLKYIKILQLSSNFNYLLAINTLIIIIFSSALFAYKNKWLKCALCVLFLIIKTVVFCLYTTTPEFYDKIKPDSLKFPINYLSYTTDKKILILAPYGDEFFKEYGSNIETMGINRDKMFTMYNYAKEFEKILDVPIETYNFLEKREYIKNYVLEKTTKNNLEKFYKSQIGALKSGEYFAIITELDYFYDLFDYEYHRTNIIDFNTDSYSHMFTKKLCHNILNLALGDDTLEYIKEDTTFDYWGIILFKKK